MRWLAAATLVFTTVAWQAHAQRAGAMHGGGGFGARSAPVARGGFSGGGMGARSFASPGAMPYRSVPAYRGPIARGYAPGVRMAPSRAYPARYPTRLMDRAPRIAPPQSQRALSGVRIHPTPVRVTAMDGLRAHMSLLIPMRPARGLRRGSLATLTTTTTAITPPPIAPLT